MKRAAFSIALAAVMACLTSTRGFADDAPLQSRIGDLMFVPLDGHLTKVNGRYTSHPGFHYARFTVSVKNIGHDAICTFLSATLESNLNVGRTGGSWTLKATNGADTAFLNSISQLLPGEELEGTIVFDNLRDGVEPVALTVESKPQSCRRTYDSVEDTPLPLTFAIQDSSGRMKISLLSDNQARQPASVNDSNDSYVPKPQEKPTKPTKPMVLPSASAPEAIYAPDPDYTDAARQVNLDGSVKLRVLVGKDGLVHDVVALNRLGKGLDEKAVAAVRKWQFTPAMTDGQPVELWIEIDVDFRRF
jgi:TonB family protein